MIESKPVTIVRTLKRLACHTSKCALCKLFLNNADPYGFAEFTVQYNGTGIMPENPLCALTRRKPLCDACIQVIVEAKEAHR